ncbi:MAG: hypothetical protein NDI94_04550 [Candidatus Woesearchaeota archaeon]|nr:hypothetical protein [Candidatus Woesearchaeota archaeon]
MDDISNRTLALLLLAAIVVSLGATVYTLNTLNNVGGFTGRAASPKYGNVTLTVVSAESFRLEVANINFGSGFVNTTDPKCQGTNSNATLFAGATYNDTNGDNCWVSLTSLPQVPVGFEIVNDGNVNLTISVTGPNSSNFFPGSTGTFRNLSWKARNNESSACTSGLASSIWKDFQNHSQTVCSKLSYYPESQDSIGIDVKVVIPATGVPAGLYEDAQIKFTGVQN